MSKRTPTLNRGKKRTAQLKAFDAKGAVVEEAEIGLDEYYEGLHALVDDDAYRTAKGIVAMEGRLFDPAGKQFQLFHVRYSSSGAYAGGRVEHADGTVNED